MNFKSTAKSPLLAVMLIAASLLIPGCKENSSQVVPGENRYTGKSPKYVILLIGDGLALPQINSAEIYLNSLAGSNPGLDKKLNLSKLPAQGLTTTHSTNSFITDSAAAGTAIATGHKTNSGVISMDPEKKVSYKTMAQIFKDMGKKVGIISSVSLDHATPATFYANQGSRNDYWEISKQLAQSNFDFYGGGALRGQTDKKRKGRADIFEMAKANGFTIVGDKAGLMSLKPGTKAIAYDHYKDGSEALPYELDRIEDSISLAEFTQKGIEMLDNEEGFFLMVEGGKIDWACHANDAAGSIMDTIAFDKAVGVALDFYKQHPQETLIVVTGDHETGGMTLGFAGTKYATAYDLIKNQTMSYDSFTASLKGYKENTKPEEAKLADLKDDIVKAFGIDITATGEKGLSEYQLQLLEDAFAQTMLAKDDRVKTDQTFLLYGGYEPLTVTLTHILNQEAGIAWTSYSHTGVPVPTFAIGAGYQLFNGYYDNTDIFKKVMAIANVSQDQIAMK